jgi:predicted DNA-binding transcriptional regulator AlpA
MMSLPETGLLRLKQVLLFIPVSRVTFLTGVKNGRFNITPIKNGRCVFYRAEDIRTLIEQMTKGGE